MKATKIKLGIMALLLTIVASLVTCEAVRTKPDTPEILQDTIFLSQWRREKAEKLSLIADYESRLATLQKTQDSLTQEVTEKKAQLAANHSQTKLLEEALLAKITRADTGFVKADSLRPLVDSLTRSCEQDNSDCNETVKALEQELAERDSSLALHQTIEGNLKAVQKDLAIDNQVLTGQLTTAYKEQRRKTRQNKLLAGGMLILSGIVTSFILTRSAK